MEEVRQEDQEPNATKEIREKIDTLLILEERGWLNELTYYNSRHGENEEDGDGYIELFDSMKNLRNEFIGSGNIETATDFKSYWNKIVSDTDADYRRITDGQPLELIEFARIWLAMQILPESNTVISDKYGLIVTSAAQYTYLKEIIQNQIIPVLNEYSVSDIKFIKKNFIQSVQSFNTNYNNAKASQKILTSTFEGIQSLLGRDPVQAYDWETESVTFSLDHSFPRYVSGLELDIFDDFKVAEYVPLVVMMKNDTKKRLEADRIFKAHIENAEQMRLYTLPAKGKHVSWLDDYQSMSIIFFVYIGTDSPKLASQKDFVRVAYSFKKGNIQFNRFTFTLTHLNVQIIIDRINERFKRFSLSPPGSKNVINIRRNFLVPNIEIDRTLMIHFITTDPVLALLFRFSEQDHPWTQKYVLTFTMFLFGDLKIVMKLDTVTSNAKIAEREGIKTSISQGTKFAKITIDSMTVSDGDVCRYIIERLYTAYIDSYDYLYNLYNKLQEITGVGVLPRTDTYKETDLEAEVEIDKDERNVFQLKRINPEMWANSNYSANIGSNIFLQVMPISKNQVDFYKSQGRDVILWPVKIRNIEPNLQASEFFDGKGKRIQHFYTTSTATQKFITFVTNPGPNSADFPLLPKCQKEPSGIIIHDNWEISVPKVEKGKTKETVKILKLLEPGQTRVGNDIAVFLGVPEVQIIGMPVGPNSLLRCVSYAMTDDKNDVFDPGYDEIFKGFREELANKSHVSMQENYDKTIEQIQKEVLDPLVPLDSLTHYRMIEEVFDINLFTIVVTNQKDYVLGIPRGLPPYVRTSRNRPCIIVFRYQPKGHLNFHYELVAVKQDRAFNFLLEGNARAKLERITVNLTRSITVSPFTKVQNGKVFTHYTVKSSENKIFYFSENFIEQIIGQSFDARGKVRTLTFDLGNEEKLSIFTEQLEPFDKPIMEPVEANINLLTKFSKLEGIVVSVKSYTPKSNKFLIGVWISLRDQNATMEYSDVECYIPLTPTKLIQNQKPLRYEIGGVVRDFEHESQTQALARYQRVVSIYLQIVKRLYVAQNLAPLEFMQRWTILVENVKLEVAGGDRYVPPSATVSFETLLAHFQEKFPNLFYKSNIQNENGRVLVDSEKTWKNLLIRLQRFQKIRDQQKILAGISTRVDKFQPFLSVTFTTPEDFTRHTKNEKIFMSYERFKLELTMAQDTNPVLVQELNAAMKNNFAPYFYLHKMRNLYLIQNVKYGDRRRAQTVSKFWKENNINSGFMTGPIASDSDVVVIDLITMEIENPEDVMILEYDRNSYGALLLIN